MNRYKGPTLGGSSKATASTLCQKCLKKDTYECKAIAQERPYVSRPSRTQQLLNPKLVPMLTDDVPQELLRKKGIADEELEKKEFERGRKRNRQNDDLDGSDERKRVRSESSYSSISVTTISTKPSPSSPFHGESSKHRNYNLPKSQISNIERKRRRSSISSEGSYMSDPNHTKDVHLGGTNDRSTRRRFNDASPMARGRKKSRTPPHGQRPSLSSDKGSPIVDGRSIRARSQSSSSHERGNLSITETTGANRLPDRGPNERQDQFSSRSGRNSTRRVRDRSFSSNSLSRRQYSIVDERYGVSSRDNGHYARPEIENRELRHRQLPRVRSLSPFSKRLALTQKMSTGE